MVEYFKHNGWGRGGFEDPTRGNIWLWHHLTLNCGMPEAKSDPQCWVISWALLTLLVAEGGFGYGSFILRGKGWFLQKSVLLGSSFHELTCNILDSSNYLIIIRTKPPTTIFTTNNPTHYTNHTSLHHPTDWWHWKSRLGTKFKLILSWLGILRTKCHSSWMYTFLTIFYPLFPSLHHLDNLV